MTESTLNLLLSGLMGALGALIMTPVNAYIVWRLRRDEIAYQHKMDVIAKERELFLQHRLEMRRRENLEADVAQLKDTVKRLEEKLGAKND